MLRRSGAWPPFHSISMLGCFDATADYQRSRFSASVAISVCMLDRRKGITKDVPLETIFRGVTPFIIAQIFLIAILIAFPSIALWLPSTMAR